MNSYLYFNEGRYLEKNSDIEFTENSKKILEKRYLWKNKEGNIVETPEDMFDRIAETMAEPDRPYRDSSKTKIEYYNLLSTKRFFPNSPTFTGAGTPLGQLAACFVLPVQDDLGRNRDSIFGTLRVAALIQQSGGGNGFSFSSLRSKGVNVSTSNGEASGPLGFLKVYDVAFGEIAQGGIRRGANMGILRVDHPDIREFIKCKSEEGQISNFNISVALTDSFMNAVRTDSTYDLIDPHTQEITESPKAREIFNLIVEYAHRNGEPGVLFIDTANKENPVPHLYDLESTNPCGEQWLGPYENCCLGSINLNRHITSDGKMDWEKLKETVILATRFLDNVVTANKYIPEVPEIEEAALNARRIGLGFMGLADAMYSLRIRYGSKEGREFASQAMEFIRFHSIKASIALAKERGPFPKIRGSIYDPDNLTWEPPKPLSPYENDWGRPQLNWFELVDSMKLYGIRNAATTTVAPTGTISTVAGVEGYGCEPVFALAYYRNVYQAAGDEGKMTLTYVSPSFQEALNKTDLNESEKKEVIEKVISSGTCQNIQNLPEWIKNTYVISSDIKPEEHVLMQAHIQAFVDNSISKTCNFPSTATREDVANVYMKGWELGCKGLTVYVAGSREEVVLETKDTKDKKDTGIYKPLERDYRLSGNTYKVQTPQGKAFITVNRTDGGRPFEVFLNVGKAGTDVAALSESLGRIISGWLREPYNPDRAVKEIIAQLSGIGGSKSIGFGKNRISSLPDAVAKVLADDFNYKITVTDDEENGDTVVKSEDSEHLIGTFTNVDMCPECGNYSLVKEEGCAKCYTCGYSEC